MASRSLLVLMVDGWRARSSGAYGNTWYGTPAFDRFASQSLVFDRYLVDSTELARVYDSLWTGSHALLPRLGESKTNLMDRLHEAGHHCQLLTDSERLLAHQLVEQFDAATYVDTAASVFAETPVDTSFGKVLGTATDLIGEWSGEPSRPRCLWIHLRGLLAPWDAPPELAESLLDEDDPELSPSIEVPSANLQEFEHAEDAVLHASCRYAAQVMALDECFGAFESVLSDLWPGLPPAIVLAGTRGFALGEHGVIGASDLPYGEQFHVPLLARCPELVRPLQRQRALVQPTDLAALLELLAAGEPIAAATAASAAGVTRTGCTFLQNDEWHLVMPVAADEGRADCELYVKPDDLWEANNVASRCPEIVAELQDLADRVGCRPIALARNGDRN